MNTYIQFLEGGKGYLILDHKDVSLPFSYFRLESGELIQHNKKFSDYIKNVMLSRDMSYCLFTKASTPDELYSMHPELLI